MAEFPDARFRSGLIPVRVDVDFRILVIPGPAGSTRGSNGAGIVFQVESTSVATRDASVEPWHDDRGQAVCECSYTPVQYGHGSVSTGFDDRPESLTAAGDTRAVSLVAVW